MRTHLDKLLRKEVVVRASGFQYRGILLEVTAEEIHLRGPTGFITIPMDRVSSVEGAQKKPKGLDPDRSVSRSFYDADLYQPDSNENSSKDPEKK